MRPKTLVTITLVLALVATLAPLSAAGRPDPQTNQERVSDPLLRNLRNLRGPGSSLGATVRDLTAAELDDQSLLNGVRIEAVRSNSPASRAELQVGDVVIEFDDELVRDIRAIPGPRERHATRMDRGGYHCARWDRA